MILFVIFIFGAVIIGAGAMLAPALPTSQPRIGLAAALALGVVIGGAMFWASLFGWNTLVVDYLMFALVTSIFLFGTLSYGQKRAEKRGEILSDADQGWTSARDLLLFALVAAVFIAPALITPVPLDTDAQGFGYLALMAKLGGNFTTLAPFHPEISYLYSPGFIALIAYLSQQLVLGLHMIQMGVGAVLGVLNVWVAYDMGSELRDKRLGRAMALAMFGGLALFLAYMDSHFTAMLALVFAQASIICMFRFLRHHHLVDVVFAGLMLGAVVLCQPDMTIILGLGLVPWAITMWVGSPRPTARHWLTLFGGMLIIALIGVSPWLISILPLLGTGIESPFTRDPANWQVMIAYHGIVVVVLAVLGAIIGLRKREQSAILAVVWLLLVLDFSTTGILPTLLGGLLAPVLRFDYPFSIAWHGPIIPYTILGGSGLLWLWDTVGEKRYGAVLHRLAFVATSAGIAVVLLVLVFQNNVLEFSKGKVGFYGAFASAADVEAMQWLKNNTPADALILNHPGPQEGDWVPVISERRSVYFRPQPFFRGTETSDTLQAEMLSFWKDPADPANADLLRSAGINYVIVPQVVGEPSRLDQMVRWRPPVSDMIQPAFSVSAAPYLTLVFDQDGARVYQVGGASETAAP